MFHSVGLLETFIEIPCQAFPVEPPSAEVESDGRGTQAPTTPKNLLERFDMEYPDPTEAPHEDGGEGLGRTLGRGGKAFCRTGTKLLSCHQMPLKAARPRHPRLPAKHKINFVNLRRHWFFGDKLGSV